MYHDILPQTLAAGGGPQRFDVPLESFERMLDTIAATGHAGCSLAGALQERARPRVAITFDDGTRGQFEYAAPALRRRGMTATFFVVTDWVGTPGFMTWDELRQMTAWGMSIQSHSRSHPFLSELDAGALRTELAESKAALDRELKQNTSQIAFPGGDAPARSLQHLLAETGYTVAAGSRWGVNREPSGQAVARIRRCSMRADITTAAARRIIAGDRWLTIANYPREAALNGIRSTLGPTRYARWRRRLLDVLAGRLKPLSA